MALRKIYNTWYAYFRDVDGTRRTRSLKTHDEATARIRHDQYMAAVNSARFNLALARITHPDSPQPAKRTAAPDNTPRPGEHRRGGIAIADMWECANKKRSLTRYHDVYWRPFREKIGVKYADQVTPKLALEYLETNYATGNGKSYNDAKSAINTIFRCCLVEAGLDISPFAPIVNRKVTEVNHHRNLTESEFSAAFAVAPLHLQIMMMLSRWTTQRLETCTRMTPAMFNFTRKVFIIDPGKTRRFKEWVCCPIMPELEKFIKPLLAKCTEPDLPIMAYYYDMGNKHAKAYISQDFSALLHRLGIEDNDSGDASFHSIRGTAITWFKEHGITGDTLRYITGHDSNEVEDIYAKPVANVSQIALDFARANSV